MSRNDFKSHDLAIFGKCVVKPSNSRFFLAMSEQNATSLNRKNRKNACFSMLERTHRFQNRADTPLFHKQAKKTKLGISDLSGNTAVTVANETGFFLPGLA